MALVVHTGRAWVAGGPTRRSRVARLSATKERVLRYPDGHVRHIRYPVAETLDEDDEPCGWDVPGLTSPPRPRSGIVAAAAPTGASVIAPAAPGTAAAKAPAAPPARRGGEGIAPSPSDLDGGAPSGSGSSGASGASAFAAPRRGSPPGSAAASPLSSVDATTGSGGGAASLADTAAYLDALFGSSYAAAQPRVDVSHCYQVLDGCPWVVPRPLYALTLGSLRPRGPLAGGGGGGGGAAGEEAGEEGLVGSTYTLRTKVVQEGASDQLAQLLGKPHLASALEVAHMRDGVVVFGSADEAGRYATRLEEEGETEVTVAEVDSHRLFRLTSDARALVVLVSADEAGGLPAPFQLAAALKGKKAWDDM